MGNNFHSVNHYTEVAISTITLSGLDTILRYSGTHPDRIILQGEKIGVNTFQLVPLRGITLENLKQSGMIESIQTIEAPWSGITGRILCGSRRKAEELVIDTLNEKPSIISIDFIEGKSAIEIAGIDLTLIHPETWVKNTYKRTIKKTKEMVFDTFHARDLIKSIGREKAMKGDLPYYRDVSKTYKEIFLKDPKIVAVHIQERNPDVIRKFIKGQDTILTYEIKTLKAHLGDEYNKIPVVIELDPLPTSPLSLKTLSGKFEAYKEKDDVIKAFVAKVNELWYG